MPKSLFEDYEGFTEKFKPKLTTDDCYTPQWCYDIVLDYVGKEVRPLSGLNVVRPFWPGENYQDYDYQQNDVVIDNPPFSIITPICDWYHARSIPFFLFAPTLTLGGIAKDKFTAVVCNASVTYENGAVVNTSFVSNMYGGNPAIVVDGELSRRICQANKEANKSAKVELPRYELPDGVLTSARLGKIATAGLSLRVERSEAKFVRDLESMRRAKKGLFGSGWIVSREAAAREATARETHYWSLSRQEEMLMDELSKQTRIFHESQTDKRENRQTND